MAQSSTDVIAKPKPIYAQEQPDPQPLDKQRAAALFSDLAASGDYGQRPTLIPSSWRGKTNVVSSPSPSLAITVRFTDLDPRRPNTCASVQSRRFLQIGGFF